jgi:hypothetical protein
MYDCHMFARVGDGSTSRAAMEARARELFAEDGSGSLYAKDERSSTFVSLGGKRLPDGHYGVTDADLSAFFDRVDEHANWEARG